MKLDVRSVNLSASDPINQYVDQKLAAAVGRFFDHVRAVTVHLTNAREPHRGADPRCQVCIRLINGSQFCIQDQEPDLYSAINHAMSRLKRTLSRRIERQRDRKRHPAE